MSQPPYPPQQPWGQPSPGPYPPGQPQHPGYPGQPGHAGPQYQPGQPLPPAPPAPPPGYGAQPAPEQLQFGPSSYPPPPAAQPKARGKLLAAAAAVVVLAGGGVATYVAFSDSGNNSAGAASPKAAVQTLVTDLNNSDFLGVLDDLAPGEKAALAGPVRDGITQLKRLKVLKSSADPNKVSAVTFRASGLTFGGKTLQVTDQVQVVEVTGGTLRVSADASRIPLTQAFVSAAFGKNAPTGTSVKTVNLADIARTQGHPLQIATQQVDGRWYPSLLYTIAQNAAVDSGVGNPSPSDRIPDNGASSPEAAVRGMLDALLAQDWRRAIELASPTELGVLHDYGALLLKTAPAPKKLPFTVTDLALASKDISGGKRLTLQSLVATVNGQTTLRVSVSSGCFDITVSGQQRKFCGSDLIDLISGSFGGLGNTLTAAQTQALGHLIDGVTSVGVDVSQTGGKWYVSGVRTLADELGSMLSSLQGNDLLELATLLRGH